MKSREALLRACTFDVAEKRRKLADLEAMIQEFGRMAQDLEQQIDAEHLRTGIRDQGHFAYSSFAKAARKRCDNLYVSVLDLERKLDVARGDLAGAEEELKRLHAAADRTEEERPKSRRGARTRMSSFRPSSRSM